MCEIDIEEFTHYCFEGHYIFKKVIILDISICVLVINGHDIGK